VAADESQDGRDVLDAILRTREHILREHDEVRVLAGLERAELAFLARRVGIPARERAHRLLARHALLRLPAAILAAPRAPGDRGVETVERARAFDREVGAAGDDDAGLEQRAPRIGAPEPVRAEAF